MDFRLTDEQEEFKKEISEFIKNNLTRELIEEAKITANEGIGPVQWEFTRKLGARHWLAPHFPQEYGGLGLSPSYRAIVVNELMGQLEGEGLVPHVIGPRISVDLAGPVILHFGSKEMKNEFLPRIARGEIEFCLGYTDMTIVKYPILPLY